MVRFHDAFAKAEQRNTQAGRTAGLNGVTNRLEETYGRAQDAVAQVAMLAEGGHLINFRNDPDRIKRLTDRVLAAGNLWPEFNEVIAQDPAFQQALQIVQPVAQ